jgi:phenylacetate-CoA ligase
MLEQDLRIPVLMSYQSNESLKIGFECEERNGYHLHEDLCIVRILDENGHSVPDGETGRVIITNLVNRGTVLINYDQGDTGRIISGPCPCGRTFRRLELGKTRSNPLLKTPDGRVIHSAEIIMPAAKWPEVMMVQIIVERPDKWRIGIFSKDKKKTKSWINEVSRIVQENTVGPSVNVSMEILDEPEKNDMGKTLPIIIRCWGEAPYL